MRPTQKSIAPTVESTSMIPKTVLFVSLICVAHAAQNNTSTNTTVYADGITSVHIEAHFGKNCQSYFLGETLIVPTRDCVGPAFGGRYTEATVSNQASNGTDAVVNINVYDNANCTVPYVHLRKCECGQCCQRVTDVLDLAVMVTCMTDTSSGDDDYNAVSSTLSGTDTVLAGAVVGAGVALLYRPNVYKY
jgi:hypothetical protein